MRRCEFILNSLYVIKPNHMFSVVIKKGKYAAAPLLTVYALRNYRKNEPTKYGISVSAKHGGAVSRNRVKRIIRAAYGGLFPALAPGWLIIVLAREKCYDRQIASRDVAGALSSAFSRLGIFAPSG